MDWHPNWSFRADASTCDRREPYKLEKRGLNLLFRILLI